MLKFVSPFVHTASDHVFLFLVGVDYAFTYFRDMLFPDNKRAILTCS